MTVEYRAPVSQPNAAKSRYSCLAMQPSPTRTHFLFLSSRALIGERQLSDGKRRGHEANRDGI